MAVHTPHARPASTKPKKTIAKTKPKSPPERPPPTPPFALHRVLKLLRAMFDPVDGTDEDATLQKYAHVLSEAECPKYSKNDIHTIFQGIRTELRKSTNPERRRGQLLGLIAKDCTDEKPIIGNALKLHHQYTVKSQQSPVHLTSTSLRLGNPPENGNGKGGLFPS